MLRGFFVSGYTLVEEGSSTPECDAFGFLQDNSFLYISYVSNNQIYKLMITPPKEQYISPECEVLDMNTDEVWLMQTSYHYQPGWDD